MDDLMKFAHAVGDATRWRILRLLRENALCVCEIADILKLPQSSVSSHLQVIRRADLLDCERCGKWIYYQVGKAPQVLLDFLTEHFGPGALAHRTLLADAGRARRRLAQRESSCCPLPKHLGGAAPTPPEP